MPWRCDNFFFTVTLLKTVLQSVLDFSRDFDVSSLDKVVMTFYSGQGEDVRTVAVLVSSTEMDSDL